MLFTKFQLCDIVTKVTNLTHRRYTLKKLLTLALLLIPQLCFGDEIGFKVLDGELSGLESQHIVHDGLDIRYQESFDNGIAIMYSVESHETGKVCDLDITAAVKVKGGGEVLTLGKNAPGLHSDMCVEHASIDGYDVELGDVIEVYASYITAWSEDKGRYKVGKLITLQLVKINLPTVSIVNISDDPQEFIIRAERGSLYGRAIIPVPYELLTNTHMLYRDDVICKGNFSSGENQVSIEGVYTTFMGSNCDYKIDFRDELIVPGVTRITTKIEFPAADGMQQLTSWVDVNKAF